MIVRRFEPRDAPALCEIYYRSVHEVACARYDSAQVAAWAPRLPDSQRWLAQFVEYETFVADNDVGTAVGWIAMTREGYLDMLFCLPEATRCGIAGELYAAVERSAFELGLARLTAHASLFAESFFKKRGWIVDERETVDRYGVAIERAVMSKRLTP
jgi:putative acetyltransferase